MVLDLGPCPAEDALGWARFARRILVEIRTSQLRPQLSPDQVEIWSQTIDRWSEVATVHLEEGRPFRWIDQLDPDVAEFLLDGLHRCIQSPAVIELCTPSELDRHRGFTIMVIRGFLDGLSTEGEGYRQYADQVQGSLGQLRPD